MLIKHDFSINKRKFLKGKNMQIKVNGTVVNSDMLDSILNKIAFKNYTRESFLNRINDCPDGYELSSLNFTIGNKSSVNVGWKHLTNENRSPVFLFFFL
jgi:hypothetical protein